jgi:rubrerythrin
MTWKFWDKAAEGIERGRKALGEMENADVEGGGGSLDTCDKCNKRVGSDMLQTVKADDGIHTKELCIKCAGMKNVTDKCPSCGSHVTAGADGQRLCDECFWHAPKENAKFDKTGKEIRPFGYELDEDYKPVEKRVDLKKKGDHGADPLGDGKFRMVPSGDIVDLAERNRRLQNSDNSSPRIGRDNAFGTAGDDAKAKKAAEIEKQRKERHAETITRLRQKVKEDPNGIWAELLKEAEARENAIETNIACLECGHKAGLDLTAKPGDECPMCPGKYAAQNSSPRIGRDNSGLERGMSLRPNAEPPSEDIEPMQDEVPLENARSPRYRVTYDGPYLKGLQVDLIMGEMSDSQIEAYFQQHYVQPTVIHKIEKVVENSTRENAWKCLECGRKFKDAAAAEKASFSDRGCPGCGGSDIDDVVENANRWEPTEFKEGDTVAAGWYPKLGQSVDTRDWFASRSECQAECDRMNRSNASHNAGDPTHISGTARGSAKYGSPRQNEGKTPDDWSYKTDAENAEHAWIQATYEERESWLKTSGSHPDDIAKYSVTSWTRLPEQAKQRLIKS